MGRGSWSPTLRKMREGWGTRSWWVRVGLPPSKCHGRSPRIPIWFGVGGILPAGLLCHHAIVDEDAIAACSLGAVHRLVCLTQQSIDVDASSIQFRESDGNAHANLVTAL